MSKDAELIMISGGRGSGKTTRTIELVQDKKRVIVLDPVGGVRAFNAKGFKEVHSIQELYRAMNEGWARGFKIIFRTPPTEHKCMVLMQNLAVDLFKIQESYYLGKTNETICVVLDEAHKYFPNRKRSPEDQEPLELFIDQGRHRGIEVIAATQRLAKMWTEYRGNATKSYFFRQGDHNDYAAVLGTIGTHHRDSLQSLQTHEYLCKGEGIEIIKDKNKCNFKKGK